MATGLGYQWTIRGGVKVDFVSPDMNWDDVKQVLNGKGQVNVLDGNGKFVEGRYTNFVELFQDVKAYTDTVNISYTVFCLSGKARIGMSESVMHDMFYRVKTFCLTKGITTDPYVWPLMEIPERRVKHLMQLISEDVQLSEAFIADKPYDTSTTERIVIRYQPR